MITVLYDTPGNLQDCNLPDISNFNRCVVANNNFVWPEKGRGHNVLNAAQNAIKLAKNP